MAIKVKVTTDNGIVTEYHRIDTLMLETNKRTSILVHSYVSEDARQAEKEQAFQIYEKPEAVSLPNVMFANGQWIDVDYDENMNIKTAYEYLKTLPQFKGAEDV